MSKDAVGARTKVAIAEQSAYETAAASVITGIDITSESLVNDIGSFASGALRADRAVHKRVRGHQSAGGDINFELNAEGLMLFYKHGLGRGISLPETDGGVRGQLSADTSANQTSLVLVNVAGSATFVSKQGGGREIVVVTYGTDSTADLNYQHVAYTVFNAATNTLTCSTGLGALKKGDYVMLRDSTAYVGIYTHYVEAYKSLPVALTTEVYRDIAVFIYSGCKVNTLGMTFPNNGMLTGTVNLLSRKEWSGDWLSADTSAAQSTLTLEDASGFPASGTISVGSEDDLAYSSKSGNILTLSVVPAEAHSQYDPVWLSKPAGTYTYPMSVVDPFSSFEAALYLDNASSEVLSANFSIANNLYADKFQLGSKFRVRAPEQARAVTGTINVEFDDMTLYSKFVRGSSASLQIRCVKDIDEVVAGSEVYYQQHLIFGDVEFNGTTPVAGGPELIVHDLPFTALYDDTYNKPEVVMILVNSQATLNAAS